MSNLHILTSILAYARIGPMAASGFYDDHSDRLARVVEESHGFACRCGWWTREQGVFVCWTRKFRLWADRNLADVQGSYPHTPHSPTAASLLVWERASEALLEPDMTIGYEMTKGMEEFAGHLRGGRSMRAWLRGWVEGRTLVSQV
jgi:hypothetical protein